MKTIAEKQIEDGFYVAVCCPYGFGKPVSMLSVINTAVVKDEMVEVITKQGEIKVPFKEFGVPNFIKLVSFSEVSIQDSLHNWFINHPKHYGKELVLDETVNTGEIYRGQSWRFSLMIEPDAKTIRYKPIFE